MKQAHVFTNKKLNRGILNHTDTLNAGVVSPNKFAVSRAAQIRAEREARKKEKEQSRIIAAYNEMVRGKHATYISQRIVAEITAAVERRCAIEEYAKRHEQEIIGAEMAAQIQLELDFKAWMNATGRRAGNPNRRERLFETFMAERATA